MLCVCVYVRGGGCFGGCKSRWRARGGQSEVVAHKTRRAREREGEREEQEEVEQWGKVWGGKGEVQGRGQQRSERAVNKKTTSTQEINEQTIFMAAFCALKRLMRFMAPCACVCACLCMCVSMLCVHVLVEKCFKNDMLRKFKQFMFILN